MNELMIYFIFFVMAAYLTGRIIINLRNVNDKHEEVVSNSDISSDDW